MLRIDGLTYEEILEDFKTHKDYLTLLLEEKVIGFSGLYLTEDEAADLMRHLYSGYSESGADRAPSVAVYRNKDGDQVSDNSFRRELSVFDVANANWHADNLGSDFCTSHIGLSMIHYDCPDADSGQTLFVDQQKLFDKCPYKTYVESLWCKHQAHGDKEHGIHPVLRTHPITARTGLHISGRFMVPEKCNMFNLDLPESEQYLDTPPQYQEFMAWLWQEIKNPENWEWWRWQEGDFLLWDNRCFVHSFTGGWSRGDRVFHRIVIGYEKPYYKPSITPGLLGDTFDIAQVWYGN